MENKVLTWDEIYKKHTVHRHEMTIEQEREFIEDCFDLYEAEGLNNLFWSPYSDYEIYNGQEYELIGRCTDKDCDLECLPMWNIRFKDGYEIQAYPEEVIPFEMKENGCPEIFLGTDEMLKKVINLKESGRNSLYLEINDDYQIFLEVHADIDGDKLEISFDLRDLNSEDIIEGTICSYIDDEEIKSSLEYIRRCALDLIEQKVVPIVSEQKILTDGKISDNYEDLEHRIKYLEEQNKIASATKDKKELILSEISEFQSKQLNQYENNLAPYNDGSWQQELLEGNYHNLIESGAGFSVNLVDFVKFGIEPYMYCSKDIANMTDYDNGHSRRALTRATNQLIFHKDDDFVPNVTVYRAVPNSVSVESDIIRDGDWITLSPFYARIHGNLRYTDDFHILKKEVPANHIYWDGQHIAEFGYDSRQQVWNTTKEILDLVNNNKDLFKEVNRDER